MAITDKLNRIRDMQTVEREFTDLATFYLSAKLLSDAGREGLLNVMRMKWDRDEGKLEYIEKLNLYLNELCDRLDVNIKDILEDGKYVEV